MAVADTAARTAPGSAGPHRSSVGAGRSTGVLTPATVPRATAVTW
ncbi:hypothetical protein V1L54_17985 [Streptomyces sp. TRM 70361]|nr:hypothetical protein [Streptomyces sp. TRM 70361]MEE1941273.1 hypothetical protein [Streptomyces sp. TRM 70361]